MGGPDEPATVEVTRPPAEARQRWRLVYRRRAEGPGITQREQSLAWEHGIVASGLPLVGLDRPAPQPRIVHAAPLISMAAERELLDFFLTERRSIAIVRDRLVGHLPGGHEIVDLHDIWLGEPSLAGQVEAADYLLEVVAADGSPLAVGALDSACRGLLAAERLPRIRVKGAREIHYDLRPLLADLRPVGGGSPAEPGSITLGLRTRFDPERGVGRPDEVLAELSRAVGTDLVARSIIRTGLILASDPSPD